MLAPKNKVSFCRGRHECETVQEAGFSGKENGELLRLAETKFDVFVTIDKNIRHQQNVSGRNTAVLIIRTVSNDLDDIRPHIPDALAALKTIRPGKFVEVEIT